MLQDYRVFNKNQPTESDKEFIIQLKGLDKSSFYTVDKFTDFSIMLQEGFQRINYSSYLRQPDGAFFWLTNEHAIAIARSIPGVVKSLSLEVTSVQLNSFSLMADNLNGSARVEDLTVAHKSEDEVTVDEALGLADLVTSLKVNTFHLWAGNYSPDALKSFCERLCCKKNCSLFAVDICDVKLPEPQDQIHYKELDVYVESNRRRFG
jgi:hypothetical protein